MQISKILSGSLEHNHDSDDRKTDRKALIVHFKRKAADNAFLRPQKITVRTNCGYIIIY